MYSTYPIKPNQTGGYNFFPDGFGINYLDFKTALLDSVLTFGFDGTSGGYFDWRLSVMAFNQYSSAAPVWVDADLHLDKDTFEVKSSNSYTDIVVIPTLVNPALVLLNNQYRFSVDDTSLVIKENRIAYGPTKIVRSNADSLTVWVRLAEDATVGLQVFDAAGERVYRSNTESGSKNGETRLYWPARNEHGEEVSSGVYIVQVRINNDDNIFKVLVIH